MSLLSLADIGIYRDQTPPGESIIERATLRPADSADGVSVASYGRLLTAQIPGEALAAYTTLLALFPAGNTYETGRWIIYAASIVACAAAVIGAYLARRIDNFHDRDTATGRSKWWRHLPYFPAGTAVFAMAIYGLTVPGSPLQQAMNASSFPIAAGCLAVGGGVIMSIVAPFLGTGNAAGVN